MRSGVLVPQSIVASGILVSLTVAPIPGLSFTPTTYQKFKSSFAKRQSPLISHCSGYKNPSFLFRPASLYSSQTDNDHIPTPETNNPGQQQQQEQSSSTKSKRTLLDIPFESDPSFAKVRVPFVDPHLNTHIDCRIHYIIKDDITGESYTIGTPHDHSVALCHMTNEGDTVFLSLEDSDEQLGGVERGVLEEAFKVASWKLVEAYDDELLLKRTPRVLTVFGDLEGKMKEGYADTMGVGLTTDELAQKILGDDFVGGAMQTDVDDDDHDNDKNKIIDLYDEDEDDTNEDEEEDDKYFEETMRRWMGDAYDDHDDDEEVDEQILQLFDSANFNEEQNIERFLKEIFLSDETDPNLMPDINDNLDNANKDDDDNVAERLFSFDLAGQTFSLVRLTKPVVLLGRADTDTANPSTSIEERRYSLLTFEEMAAVAPRIERVFREELKESGVTLPWSSAEGKQDEEDGSLEP